MRKSIDDKEKNSVKSGFDTNYIHQSAEHKGLHLELLNSEAGILFCQHNTVIYIFFLN